MQQPSDLFQAVDDFFLNGKLLRQINNTSVSFLPKIENPMHIKDFRPIACCNTIYKVITKILYHRMQLLMPHLVLPNQSAFVYGRLMQHNILPSQELIRGYSQKNISPRCLLKIDLQKAYDTLSWSFLRDVLQLYGFDPWFIDRVMTCISFARFSFKVNRRLEGLL